MLRNGRRRHADGRAHVRDGDADGIQEQPAGAPGSEANAEQSGTGKAADAAMSRRFRFGGGAASLKAPTVVALAARSGSACPATLSPQS